MTCSLKSLSMQSLEFSFSHLCHTNTFLRKVLGLYLQYWKMGTNGQNGPFKGLTYGLLFHQWAQNYEGSFLFPSENSRDEALFFVLLLLFFLFFLLWGDLWPRENAWQKSNCRRRAEFLRKTIGTFPMTMISSVDRRPINIQ